MLSLAFLSKLFAPKPKFTTCRCSLCPRYVDVDAQLKGRGFLCSPCFMLHTTSQTPVDLMERFPREMAAWGRHIQRESARTLDGGKVLDLGEIRALAQDLMSESVQVSLQAFESAKSSRYIEHQELSRRAAELRKRADELVSDSIVALREMGGEA